MENEKKWNVIPDKDMERVSGGMPVGSALIGTKYGGGDSKGQAVYYV